MRSRKRRPMRMGVPYKSVPHEGIDANQSGVDHRWGEDVVNVAGGCLVYAILSIAVMFAISMCSAGA